MTQVYFFSFFIVGWFTQERSFRICHLFCFANQIFNFAEPENKFKFDNGWGDETRNNPAGSRIIKPFKSFKSNENC